MARKLWIDQAEFMVLRESQTVVGDHSVPMPGTTWQTDYELIHKEAGQEAWQVTSISVNGKLHFAKMVKPQVHTEIRNSKFQKFDVKSTITVEQPPSDF